VALKKSQLVVKPSRIPGAGMGLFSTINIKKGQQIIEYKGRLERWCDVKKEDGYNGYLLRVHRLWAINALPFKKALGRFANDALGIGRHHRLRNNAEYVVYGLKCFIEATRDIRKGEEILVSYGNEYWELIRKIRKERQTSRVKKR
jgi:SET domain-containing protein